jgi:hypothetical protein
LRGSDDADRSAVEGPLQPLETQDEAEPVAELPPNEVAAAEQAAEPVESSDQAEPPTTVKDRAVRPPVANLSLVRRERRTLLRERERRIRDLGGLLLEMYRRDQFREDLIVEHCAQAMGIENRIHELEAILARAKSRRAAPGPHCACGAPLYFGARFCASCGRPTDLAATGELCARCLQPLALGANFCGACGATVAGASAPEAATEQTVEHSSPLEEGKGAQPAEGA